MTRHLLHLWQTMVKGCREFMDRHEDELDGIILKALKSPDVEFSACHQLLGDLME